MARQLTGKLPQSIDETRAMLEAQDYLAGTALATVLFLALRMKRPLFLEGEAGVGKTEIAKDRQRARRRSADQPARRLPASQGPARLQPGIGIDQRHTADLRDQQAGLRPAQPVAGPILVLMHSARPCKADRTLARSSNAIYLFGIVLTLSSHRLCSSARRCVPMQSGIPFTLSASRNGVFRFRP